MNTLLVVFALLLATQSIAAQTRILVANNRVPVAVALNYPGGLALPTICDGQGRLYVKLVEAGPGMKGPLFRLSSTGTVEAKFDTSGAFINRYAVRPDGGVIMIHSEQGATWFIDNFAPDGTRESSVALERPPVPFFPSQIAVFESGKILLSGPQIRPGYKASTAVFDPKGRLVNQLVLEGDVVTENAIANDTRAQQQNISAIGKSVAVIGDDGLVYLMRATSPVTVYAISSAGKVVRQIVVGAPSIQASPDFGVRVAKNKLTVQFQQPCDASSDSCRSNACTVVDATTGKQLAVYEAEKEAQGPLVCFAPDPDRFVIFSQTAHGLDIVEAEAEPK
jgi:hypothetical protein